MAKEDNLLGIVSIEFGTPGNGVMGASLTAFTAVEVNSTNMSGAEAQDETIDTEQEDAYLTVGSSVTPTELTSRLFEVHAANAVLLMGGTFDAPSGEYRAPISIPDKYLSVRLTTKSINGVHMELDYPYAKVTARYDGNITKNGLLAVEAKITANTPVTSAGVKGSPFIIRKVVE